VISLMNQMYWGNSLLDWGFAFAVAIVIIAVLSTIKLILVRRLFVLAKKTDTYLDDVFVAMLSSTKRLFLLVVAVYFSSHILVLSTPVQGIFFKTLIVALLVQMAIWGDKGVRVWLSSYLEKKQVGGAINPTSTAAIGFISRVIIWSVALLMALDNLGFNIVTLVASLGIGGIAVALALQNILGDLFASLSIVLDKPFSVGDYIVVDDAMGTVEFIGLKSTRLISITGEQIVFSNADLLKSRIRNYKHMHERRILFTIGVVYHTSEVQLKLIPQILKESVDKQDKVRFLRAHLKTFADSSIDFEIVYYISDPDYNTFMDIQQAINLEIFRRFTQEKIDFAFPSRTVYIENAPLKPE
jgi:small-conductance mechanosensitive channel